MQGTYVWSIGPSGISMPCFHGDTTLVQERILNPKGAIDWSDAYFHAALGGHMEILKYLLSKNEMSVYSRRQAFRGACLGGHLNVIEFFISMPRERDWGNGLEMACRGGHMHVAELMISKGEAKWNLELEDARSKGYFDFVTKITAEGAHDWSYCFQQAWIYGNIKIAHLMISKGADVTKHNCAPKWPNDKLKICELLYLGTPVEKFSEIDGYQELYTQISEIKRAILCRSVMILDLLRLVSQFIII